MKNHRFNTVEEISTGRLPRKKRVRKPTVRVAPVEPLIGGLLHRLELAGKL